MLFSRNMEDFVTWVDTSAIKKHILEYNDAVSNKSIFYIILYLLRFNVFIYFMYCSVTER